MLWRLLPELPHSCLSVVMLRRMAAGETLASERAPALTICDQWDAAVAIVTIHGEIDISTVGTLSEHLGDLARKNPRRLVIDLAGVSFIDSSGVSGFARVRKALPPDCPVVIRSAQRRIRQVFTLTGLDSVLVFE